MRQARATDYWRRLCNNPPNSTCLHLLKYSNVEAMGNGIVEFTGTIVGICGANGVGKTTLLSLLYCALSNTSHNELLMLGRIGDFTVDQIELDLAGKRIVNIADLATYAVEAGVDIWMIDSATQASNIQYRVGRDQSFNDILEQVSPTDFSQESLDEISYLVGKAYTNCLVYEIEDYSDNEVFPYFVVKSDSIEYGSERMGKGELAALLLYWNITRVRANGILLFEEPEAHLPVRTQVAFMNILAREVIEKSLFVVMSTHSAEILSKIRHADLRVVSRMNGQVRVLNDVGHALLSDMFGVKRSIRGVLLVEDSAAMHFLRTVLEAVLPELNKATEIAIAGSDGDVYKALKNFPKDGLTRICLAGVLDGDQRDAAIPKNYEWPIFFLPGKVPPEKLFRLCDFTQLQFLSKQLNVGEDQLHAALGYLVGEDHHDWLTRLAQLIDRSYKDCCNALTKYWLETSGNKLAATRLAIMLEKFVMV